MTYATCPLCGNPLQVERELISFTKMICEYCFTTWFHDAEKGVLTFNMTYNLYHQGAYLVTT